LAGPWGDRRFEPTAWRPPVAQIESSREAVATVGVDRLTGIVIGYIASVVTSVAIVLTFLKVG